MSARKFQKDSGETVGPTSLLESVWP